MKPTRLRLLVEPLQLHDLPALMAIEQQAYPYPWSEGNFTDSLAAGYEAWAHRDASGRLCAYFVAMMGVDEMHLLNFTVAPSEQGKGLGRALLHTLLELARSLGAAELLLEVRPSNTAALGLYQSHGFQTVGRRRGYYPAEQGREDALVMKRACSEAADEF
jgi:ribosomal-protein-alanine N-acetyltransferase